MDNFEECIYVKFNFFERILRMMGMNEVGSL